MQHLQQSIIYLLSHSPNVNNSGHKPLLLSLGVMRTTQPLKAWAGRKKDQTVRREYDSREKCGSSYLSSKTSATRPST